VTDGRTQAAHAVAQQAAPLRDGVADIEKLPAAESRTCQPTVRKLTTHLIDALAERGYCDLAAGPPAALTRAGTSARALARPGKRSARPDWWSGLIHIDSLALIFSAEAYGAR
jgi:hypothetical protein